MEIIVGVTASIAIYKSCELVRLLKKNGVNIKVVMTPTAASWISPVVFTALSESPAYVEDTDHSTAMAHIELRKNTDLMIVAPATAEFISQAAAGSAGTLLSALMLSYNGPKLIAPSMNPTMYANPIVQENIKKLENAGIKVISPDNGEALCGDPGEGKMAPVEQIFSEILGYQKK